MCGGGLLDDGRGRGRGLLAGGEAGPSNRADPGVGARWDAEQAERRRQEAAAEEAAKQMGALASPSKSPPPKKPKKGGDGASSSQAVELTETEE